jgi:anti-anti-sigma factor
LNRRLPSGLMCLEKFPTFGKIMTIEKKISGESLELMLSDRVDGLGANELEVAVLAAIKQGYKAIYVNLAQATFLCSAGIRVLLQYHRQMKGKGLTLLVSRPSPEVASALEMTGFPELVEQ